jgi:hypothetical protein
MAAHESDPCECGRETFVQCDACDRWYCAACVQLAEEEIDSRDQVWCPGCQRREFVRAQHLVAEKSRRSQEAIDRCLRTRTRVLLSNPPAPRTHDAIMARIERLHLFLHVEPYGDGRCMVVGKDHDNHSPKAWNAISLIAGYLLDLPIWIDPLTDDVLERVDGARRPGETYPAALERLKDAGELTYDDCYVVPKFAHEMEDSFVLPADEPWIKCMCNQLIRHVLVRRWGAFDFTTGQRCNALTRLQARDQQPTAHGAVLMQILLAAMHRAGARIGRRDARYQRRRSKARAGHFVLA